MKKFWDQQIKWLTDFMAQNLLEKTIWSKNRIATGVIEQIINKWKFFIEYEWDS